MTKYRLDQLIWYLKVNRVHSAPVLAIKDISNKHPGHTKEQKELFQPFGEAGVWYATCHGIVKEENCFSTREELISHLATE